jgi:NADPH-dependent glutamate synthase beta subunit-like oxidoreductase/Pyruvate/2-oxoacid:ferredoxin oxidoreductase delta subunit
MSARAGIPPIWTTGTTEVFKTGTWRAALPKHIRAPSPCHGACPVNGDIAEWIGHAKDNDFHAAWQVLTRHNPFPAIVGRVCHHPCEAACNRAGYDESLAISSLERFIGDRALAEGWSFPAADLRHSERIAIVGGGPSGLSAAYHLRREGYAVTLFEARADLGGLMRDGIPGYRLPRDVLDGEIARIVALGVDVRRGHPLARPEDLARLRDDFEAIYVAIGARRQKRLPRLDYAKPWVMDGAEYLAQSNAGSPPALGRRVVVIGGGSAAIDAARSARRAGHDVTVLALESAQQMPAQREEVVEAREEGVAIVESAMLVDAVRRDDGVALRCVNVRFVPGATRGQFTVTPIEGSEFTFVADAIVPSIGQDPDLAPLAELRANGALLDVDSRQATSVDTVYAGGDVASMARFVTEAIGMGKRAAAAIHEALRGSQAPVATPEPEVALRAINTFYHPHGERVESQRRDVADRLIGDAEVQFPLDIERALAEAERCFSCGTCIHCDNCVVYCPDLAVRRDGDRYVILNDYCKGCGLCVRECPTGSMTMVEETK